MEALWSDSLPDESMDPKWGKMFVLAILFHVTVFCLLLFVPDSMPTRRIPGEIYEVNLVEMPVAGPTKARAGSPNTPKKEVAPVKKVAPAQRISAPAVVEEKPVVIAKRTVPRKSEKKTEPKESPAKLIDQALAKIQKKVEAEKRNPLQEALSRIEKNVETEQQDHVGEAISGIENRVKNAGGSTPLGSGMGNWRYQMEVRDWVKNNWSYPALLSVQNEKDLEAVFVLTVKSDGKILRSRFEKKSANPLFDQSVLKAIERSDPLPPFPPGYHKSQDELEITFNLKDLSQQ
jgi:colicin import membrane protein